MDDPDDRDLKIQRASGDLIKELTSSLPRLLWKTTRNGPAIPIPHRWALATRTDRLIRLLEPFQEWPQLLDPHLAQLLPQLVDAFLAYLVHHRGEYASRELRTRKDQLLYPLPRAICKLLYTFCKVRGVKVISRFLNNEPKYLDPLLRAFMEWDSDYSDDGPQSHLEPSTHRPVWEERYVLLTWLAHLLLAPFDLASMSSDDIPVPHGNLNQLGTLPAETPAIAKALLSLSLHYVNFPSKEQEAASLLLARLALRRDMQAIGLLPKLSNWVFVRFRPGTDGQLPSVYTCIGLLSFLSRLAASGQVDDFAPLVVPIFRETLRIAQEQSEMPKVVRSSAIARKLMVKVLRNVVLIALSLNEKGDGSMTDEQVSSLLEDTIDHLLVTLADKDTPVRFAASKALSVIVLRLEAEMAAEVIEAVTGSLEENVLFEKVDGSLITPFEAKRHNADDLKRNLSAVDAQRWHGLILTLAHLLFRRAPPPHQLPDVLQSLISGLDFEQRLTTGSSVGVGVRDASCFGIWALSRKYTTDELLSIRSGTINAPTYRDSDSVLQLLAVELVCAACVDPSGNIRRGASAALQELIGRHPNTIREGIPLVQIVDYHAVALRSRAMIEVGKATAALDNVYWSPLVESLLHWRGIAAFDAESRRHAARALGSLSTHGSLKTIVSVLRRLTSRFYGIPRTDVETRHGCMLAMAAVVDAYCTWRGSNTDNEDENDKVDVACAITGLWDILLSEKGPNEEDLTLQSARPDLTAESCSHLVHSLSKVEFAGNQEIMSPHFTGTLDRALHIVLLSLARGEEIATDASSGALSELFTLLPLTKQSEVITRLSDHIQATLKLPTGRGYISALGAVFRQLPRADELRSSIIKTLLRCAARDELIEKRVVAVKCLADDILPNSTISDDIAMYVVDCLNDYTTDRRGDIGSLVRVEAVGVARIILQREAAAPILSPDAKSLLGCLCRLAAEKLDKVRLQAWICLQEFWQSRDDFPALRSHVSAPDYFLQLLELERIHWLRLPLLQGFATSAVTGAEGLVRSSRSALIQYINACDKAYQEELLGIILNDVSAILSENSQDDRYAIPAVEFLAFFIDSYVSPHCDDLVPRASSLRRIFILTQKTHFKTSNLARLEAAIKAYAALSRSKSLRQEVLKKLTTMLLHPFPRIRTTVADYVYVETGSDLVRSEDWTQQPKQLKAQVEQLRTVLGV